MAKPSKKRRHPQARPDAFFTQAEADAAKKASRQATARTSPEVLDAFASLPLSAGELRLRPLSWADFMLLERLESPFADSSIAQGADISQLDVGIAVYVLTRPNLDTLDLLAASGRPAVERAAIALAGRIPAEALAEVGAKLQITFARAFATLVGGEKKTQTAHSAPPPATASGGG